MAIFEYINGLVNQPRRHSTLGSKSPVAFERSMAQTSTWSGARARQAQLVFDLLLAYKRRVDLGEGIAMRFARKSFCFLFGFTRGNALSHLGSHNLFGLARLCKRYVGILTNRQKPLFPVHSVFELPKL
nr:hypothetical protein [Pacificibacter marinus]